jgi:hypothetical protein
MTQARLTLSPSEEAEEKKWSPKRFYRHMRFRFRLHRDCEDPNNPPDPEDTNNNRVFVPLHKYRLLSLDEFEGCQQRYVYARQRKHLKRMDQAQKGRALQHPSPDRWPDLQDRGLDPALYDHCEHALGCLYFVDTKDQRAQASGVVKALATRGPIWLRRALKIAVSATPRTKRTISGFAIFKLVAFRAKREFLWTFLRHEANWTGDQQNTPAALMDAARTLATVYKYLNLTADDIAKGLNCLSQADQDTADEFGLKSASSVRFLISKSARR